MRIPELAAVVKTTIDNERKRNPSFVRAFDDFYARSAVRPSILISRKKLSVSVPSTKLCITAWLTFSHVRSS
ncbi:MAG: hypothetical protein DMG93_12145 [Acidobacteria bacterium]|nr:MAG: hypothetical protein DMG93_12145 [Acidobacteriota bacterium]